MIERYSLTAESGEIARKFNVSKIVRCYTNRFNVSPTQTVSIIMNDRHQQRMIQESRWGLYPFWAKDAINAEHSTLFSKPFLDGMLRRQRCVVPCSGFFGRRPSNIERDPQTMHVVIPNEEVFGIAGIYDCWRSPSGEEQRAFTIITAPTSGAMSSWQPRVPVILDEEGVEDWLNPRLTELSGLRKHLEAMDSYLMRAYPVTNEVQHDSFESPDCIREIATDFAIQ